MVYKKYIKKDGKLYGPYVYHSRRVNGKVVSEYHGVKKKINYKNLFLLFLGVLLMIVLVYVLMFSKGKISGKAVLDLEADYQEGQPLEGSLALSLKKGELIPASSKIVFETSGKEYEYNLEELVSDELVEGNFYLERKNISGLGLGYGVEGAKRVYPEISFTLYTYSQTTLEEDLGEVSMEFGTEVQGGVSASYSFVYDLEEGQTAEVLPRSVRTNSEKLPDDAVEMNIEGNKVIVTTNYSVEEKGFGRDYLGNDKITFALDLDDLNLFTEQGELKISLVYDEEEIISLTTLLEEGKITANESFEADIIQDKTKTESEIIQENQTSDKIITVNITKVPDILTEEEREILLREFGNVSVNTPKTEVFNGRLLVRFEIGGYSRESTYDYSGEITEEIKSQIERDITGWLKDLAKELSQEETIPEKIENFSINYSIE